MATNQANPTTYARPVENPKALLKMSARLADEIDKLHKNYVYNVNNDLHINETAEERQKAVGSGYDQSGSGVDKDGNFVFKDFKDPNAKQPDPRRTNTIFKDETNNELPPPESVQSYVITIRNKRDSSTVFSPTDPLNDWLPVCEVVIALPSPPSDVTSTSSSTNMGGSSQTKTDKQKKADKKSKDHDPTLPHNILPVVIQNKRTEIYQAYLQSLILHTPATSTTKGKITLQKDLEFGYETTESFLTNVLPKSGWKENPGKAHWLRGLNGWPFRRENKPFEIIHSAFKGVPRKGTKARLAEEAGETRVNARDPKFASTAAATKQKQADSEKKEKKELTMPDAMVTLGYDAESSTSFAARFDKSEVDTLKKKGRSQSVPLELNRHPGGDFKPREAWNGKKQILPLSLIKTGPRHTRKQTEQIHTTEPHEQDTEEPDKNIPTLKNLKAAYRKFSKKYHPDKTIGKSQEEKDEAANKFSEIQGAYDFMLERLGVAELAVGSESSWYEKLGGKGRNAFNGGLYTKPPSKDWVVDREKEKVEMLWTAAGVRPIADEIVRHFYGRSATHFMGGAESDS